MNSPMTVSYTHLWDEYGEIERETIMKEARDFRAIRYTSYEQIGRDYRFDISSDNMERFSAFAKKFERVDILAVSIMNPFEIQRDNCLLYTSCWSASWSNACVYLHLVPYPVHELYPFGSC